MVYGCRGGRGGVVAGEVRRGACRIWTSGQQRLVMAGEARSLGHGGIAAVARATRGVAVADLTGRGRAGGRGRRRWGGCAARAAAASR